MLSIGLSLFARLAAGVPALPAGFAFVTDADGTRLVDADGCYLLEAI